MQNDPIQGQGQGHQGLKVAKMADFKVYLLPGVHVIKRLMNNYDIGQYLFFFGQSFEVHPRLSSRDLQS